MADNWVSEFVDPKERDYLDLRYISSAQFPLTQGSGIFGLATVGFQIDEQFTVSTRTVYTLSFIFSLVGGLSGIAVLCA